MKLPFKLVFSENGISGEIYSSHGSRESAEKKSELIMAEARARRHTFLYNGWWIVVDTSKRPQENVSVVGVGRMEGKPLPDFRRMPLGPRPS